MQNLKNNLCYLQQLNLIKEDVAKVITDDVFKIMLEINTLVFNYIN